MQNAVHPTPIWADLAEMTHSLERRFGLSRLKRGMLAMLAGWLGYFVVVSMSVRALNKVTVPFLDMPLGVFLAAQGTAVIFLAALILLVKTSGRSTTPARFVGAPPARIRAADRALPRPDCVPLPGSYAQLPMKRMSTSRRCGRTRCSAT